MIQFDNANRIIVTINKTFYFDNLMVDDAAIETIPA